MAGGSGTIFIEGFLIKRGHMRHNWKTRWFKLSEASLRYYKDQKHNVPQGRIPLQNAILTKDAKLGNGDADRSVGNEFGAELSVCSTNFIFHLSKCFLTTAMIARSRFDSHPSYVVASLEKMLHDDYLCLVDSDKQQIKENVFIVTTVSGVQYPVQAGTTQEFSIWTDSIQKVIDSLDPEKLAGQPLPQHSGIVKSDCQNCQIAVERRKAGMNAQIGKPQEGNKANSTNRGVFSGVELRRWIGGVLGVGKEEAEDAIKTLIQIGFIECLTAGAQGLSLYDNSQNFRVLADESSIKNLSTSYLSNFKANETASTSPKSQQQKTPGLHGPCLPTDLPPGDVVKRGILFKRGHIVPSWKARCFVLQQFPATLSYFDPAKKNLKTINSLDLHGASAFAVTKADAESALKISNPPEHLLCVKTAAGALYLIIAASEQEKTEWIEAIMPLCRKMKE